MFYVYFLVCDDKRTYIGCTDDLKDRIERHKNKRVPATASRLPVKLVSYFAFIDKYTAYNFEKYFKTGSGRAFLKKHKMIDNLKNII
jgi:predicted GIY-YIG superfamily endonuclease